MKQVFEWRSRCTLLFAGIVLSKTDDVGRDHLIHRKRSPFPYEGKALTPLQVGCDCECRVRHFRNPASEALLHCPAGRSPAPSPPLCGGGVGWRGLPLRTIKGADSGFRRTYGFHPRLRVSAGIRFAVRSLSEALDRENSKVQRPGWHLIQR